ncbi:MAG: hypothetical protein KKH41_03620 [Candidatus Thermoplasmatota archaeon]|nr:hypothetical protein [Euryarchaeota archaeon]MBU4032966.1 hypothetical protein [Candidatus Thermoplasmatota archaeon]MBU4071967.1 hypothetical protein [Candidatus Thermoplasmatota archaeon]MBU4144770.1 hypothetical protein [Candidatus Thermoplasmatota archaeon]MBU4591654.1 hypothetical protein [Candidatus Thermoplasmatota archaeon]
MQQNIYPYQKSWKLIVGMIVYFVTFLVFLLWYIFAEEYSMTAHGIVIKDTVESVWFFTSFMIAASLLGVIGTGIFLFGGFYIHTIVVSDQGIELQRKRGSILITKLNTITERNPNTLRVEGVTAEGKPIKKMFGCGEMNKDNWPDFKRDIKFLWERQQSGQQSQVPYPPPPPPP